MSSDSRNILDAVLNLSDPERANLAYRLLQSLQPPEVVSGGDANFDAELEQRVEDYEAGRTTASHWDEVAARLTRHIFELLNAAEMPFTKSVHHCERRQYDCPSSSGMP